MLAACKKVQKILCIIQESWGREFHSLTTCRQENFLFISFLSLTPAQVGCKQANFLFPFSETNFSHRLVWLCCSTDFSEEKVSKCFLSKSALPVLSILEGCSHHDSSVCYQLPSLKGCWQPEHMSIRKSIRRLRHPVCPHAFLLPVAACPAWLCGEEAHMGLTCPPCLSWAYSVSSQGAHSFPCCCMVLNEPHF